MIEIEKYKAGHYEKQSGYQYFVPSLVNQEWIWNNPEINLLLEKAARQLGELNSFSKIVPDIDSFIRMHVGIEAVVSSRIEGTKTSIEEIFLPESEISPERKNDWQEVNNYVDALNYAIEELKLLPISTRLIRKIHEMLLSNSRGENKQPGEFRRSQNWIGGNTLHDATFIPPNHQYLDSLMNDLENFLHNENIRTPALIRIAIAHYQFETIHPFLDGNGRIGRLLIPLYLVSEKLLDKPLLYISRFFEKNKGLYYDNLTRVRSHNDITQWIKYFLSGIEETSALGVKALLGVIKLKEQLELEIREKMGRKAHNALKLLNYLFLNPVITINETREKCKLSFKSAAKLVNDMEKMNILEEFTGQSRNRIFIFSRDMQVIQSNL